MKDLWVYLAVSEGVQEIVPYAEQLQRNMQLFFFFNHELRRPFQANLSAVVFSMLGGMTYTYPCNPF